jgi:hypothetical protein
MPHSTISRFKLLLASTLLASALLASPGHASAHILKQNNGVLSVMHIEPDDKPLADELTTILIDFDTTSGAFHIADCDCKIALTEAGKVIPATALVPAFTGTNFEATSKVTFPKPDVYHLVVSGTSKDHLFGNFSVSYDIRVPAYSPHHKSNQPVLYLLFGIVGLGFVSIIGNQLYAHRRLPSKRSS